MTLDELIKALPPKTGWMIANNTVTGNVSCYINTAGTSAGDGKSYGGEGKTVSEAVTRAFEAMETY